MYDKMEDARKWTTAKGRSGNFPSNKGNPNVNEENRLADIVLLLRVTLIVCLLIASMSVLDSFIALFAYWAFLTGKMNPAAHPEWYAAFQEIHQTSARFIALNVYSLLLWNGVILGSIWLLRFHAWSRQMLVGLLGLDMIVTVALLLWEAWTKTLQIAGPGWFITLNVLQTGAIVVLSHPRVIELTEQLSPQNKHPEQSKENTGGW